MVSYFGIDIRCPPGVYAPAEDSVLLAEAVDSKPGEKVLDMGTGSGLLGLIAARRGGDVLVVDINEQALQCARENAVINGIGNFAVSQSDLFSNVEEAYDLIIFNPPYLPTEEWEPNDLSSKAWDGGQSGREVIDRFLEDVKEYLLLGGRLLTLASSLSGIEQTISVLLDQGFEVFPVDGQKLDFEDLVVIMACL